MELLTLNEISELNGVYSDERYLYIPLVDERIVLRAILSTNNFRKTNIGFYGIKVVNISNYAMISFPYLFNMDNSAKPIKKEINIDKGNVQEWSIYRQNLADFIFAFGEQYAHTFLESKEIFHLPNKVEIVNVHEAVLVDTEGNKLGDQGNNTFLHIADEHTLPQYFFPAFQKRHQSSLNFTGVVYEDEYFAWAFIESSGATLGQVFLAGVSWVLNYKTINNVVFENYKNDLKATCQYPAWEGFQPDFHRKWPWSEEYDGSTPDIAIKHIPPTHLR